MMGHELPLAAEVRPAADLAALAAEINAEHRAGEAAARKGMDHFRKAGAALLKAKAACQHGGWLPWLKKNCPDVAERKAQRYMALAKSDAASDLEEQWRAISGHAPARPVAELRQELAELRRELWVRQWEEEGVTPPATTGRQLREENAFGPLLDDDAWDKVLYKLLVEKAAPHFILTGRLLPYPFDLNGDGRAGVVAEQNRVACWEIEVQHRAGRFLNWCEKAGVRAVWKKGHLAGFRLPERPFAGAKEALREDVQRDPEGPFTNEDAAEFFDVDVADLPQALHAYTIGTFHLFFDLKMLGEEERSA
jgi:hypothetical protein